MLFKRLLFSPFGEIPALFTNASKRPFSFSLISEITFIVLLGSARSTCMWSAAPPGQGHLSSKGFLEQVSTLQPSAENLFTVACPIPVSYTHLTLPTNREV